MANQTVYKELSKKLMMENSEILPRIWSLVCTEEEAEMVNLLPGTVEDIAERAGKSVDEMNAIMQSLFHKGAAFESVRDGKTYYRMPRHVVQFHDATILWQEAPPEMIELWVEFTNSKEYHQLLELATEVKLPAFLRVIPINTNIEAKSQILVYEDAAKLVEDARSLAVTTCVCRKSMKNCNGPLEVCLQLNRGADYTIKRGTGRKIDVQEALAILKKSEEAGLVHMTDNRAGSVNVLCNCCSCCCEILRYATDAKTKGILAPSRYQASVDKDECTSCGMCIDICPTNALSMSESDVAEVNTANCIGCGLCASTCPIEAIILKEVKTEEFIPLK